MSCPDCAAAFDQGWSAVEERYADLLAAAEEVLRSSHSGCACFECEQLAAAIKKAKGQQ